MEDRWEGIGSVGNMEGRESRMGDRAIREEWIGNGKREREVMGREVNKRLEMGREGEGEGRLVWCSCGRERVGERILLRGRLWPLWGRR